MDEEFFIKYIPFRWNAVVIRNVPDKSGKIDAFVKLDKQFGSDLSILRQDLVYDPSYNL